MPVATRTPISELCEALDAMWLSFEPHYLKLPLPIQVQFDEIWTAQLRLEAAYKDELGK